MEIVRHIYDCNGVCVGYLVRNEHGGSFFVGRDSLAGVPSERNIAQDMRECCRNQGATPLRRSFA